MVSDERLLTLNCGAHGAGPALTESSTSSLEKNLYMDRRRFLSATALSLTTFSLRLESSLAADETRVVTRTITAECRYLNLPVNASEAKRHLKMMVDGQIVREFNISLAEGNVQWWAFADLAPLMGKAVIIEAEDLPGSIKALATITQSDQIIGHDALYHEAVRPQFHFSTRRGWQSDPNGLVFYGGEYHLFYQHDPYDVQSPAAMHWGHAVSKDLVHWTELPDAIYPEEGYEDGIWSGSAVVDSNNVAGFQTGAEKPIITIFTYIPSAGKAQQKFIQGIAFSNDRGRTWTKYNKNPVLPNVTKYNRDPKVIWYAPEQKWVMALFLDQTDDSKYPDLPPMELLKRFADRSSFGLFSSRDLKTWAKMSEFKIQGETECPEFFEISVDGNTENTRWIAQGASGRYLIGSFDGKSFMRESGPHMIHSGDCFYASQTFNNLPVSDGRRILIPWAGGDDSPATALYKGMPFNQMMGVPLELTLRTTADAGLRLFVVPVKELESLRTTTWNIKPQPIKAGENPLAIINVELFDLAADIAVGDTTEIVFNLRGVPVTYDVKAQELSCNGKKTHLRADSGKIRLRMLVDRTSIDIFGSDGRLYMPIGVAIDATNTSLRLHVEGNGAFISALDVSELKSIWT
jgi:sucrose-6-phosphate hydrolase SacC (GH32 family)